MNNLYRLFHSAADNGLICDCEPEARQLRDDATRSVSNERLRLTHKTPPPSFPPRPALPRPLYPAPDPLRVPRPRHSPAPPSPRRKMALQSDIADLDAWIEKLKECKQLDESEVKELCKKVCCGTVGMGRAGSADGARAGRNGKAAAWG